MPKLSIIIPTYNRAHLIQECIQSVLAESFRDVEVIVVDDGSSDSTRRVVSAFPVKYIYQENQGAPAARNKGLNLARGEYVIFLDSDDVILHSSLSKGAGALARYPQAGFSYGQAYLIDERGHIFGLRGPNRKRSSVREGWEEIGDLILGNYIPSPTVMIRRSCLDAVGGFDPTFRFGSQDFELWVRLARRYAVAYIAEPLAKFRVHRHTMTSSRTLEEMEQTHCRILESVFGDEEMGHSLSAERPRAYSHLYLDLAAHAYSRKEMKTARGYLLKAMKTSPSVFFKGLGLSRAALLAKTWVPSPVMTSARACRHCFRVGACLFFSHRQKARLGVEVDAIYEGK